MKKQIAITMAILMCLAVFMVGCRSGDETLEDFPLYDYDLSEYVELAQFKGIEVPARLIPDTDVSDADLLSEIHGMLTAAGTMDELFEGTVMDGDIANIDFTGYRDGVAFPGGAGEGFDLTIGSGMFIPGFEEGLIGKNIGDTVVIEITFPEDYHAEELAGVDVEFEVSINAVTRFTPPELTDEFVQEISAYDTVEEFKEAVREQIREHREAMGSMELRSFLWGYVLDNSTVLQQPDREITVLFDTRKRELRAHARQLGFRWSEFLEEVEMTEEELDEFLMEDVRTDIEEEMVLVAIARQVGVDFTDDASYEAGRQELLNLWGFESAEEFRELHGETAEQMHGRRMIHLTILFERVMAIMQENMVVVE